MIGEQLGERYDVVAELGRGGMGVVFRAYDRLLEREVAIKVLPPEQINPEAEERFRREVRAVARLEHAGIVPIYDFDRHGETIFFVMPLLRGRTLRRILEERPLHVAEAVAVGAQVAAALDYSHQRNIIHRDIKPENLMISGEDDGSPSLTVKVMDFGIAAVSSRSSHLPQLTQDGHLVGTPAYLSPEQINGHPVDPRTDIYALGTVLYECLAGALPFAGGFPALLYQIAHAAPRSLAARGVDPELDALIQRCLAKDPDERPRRARDLAEALTRIRDRYAPRSSRAAATPFAVTRDAIPSPPNSARYAREQEVLSIASIFGEGHFSARDLAHLNDADDLEEVIDRLVEGGQLVEDTASLRGRLAFASEAARETAYRALPRRRRRELHRRFAEALERQFAQRIDRALDRLARHWARADEPQKAVHYGLLAARKALDGGQRDVAAALARSMLEFVEDPAWDGERAVEEQVHALMATLSRVPRSRPTPLIEMREPRSDPEPRDDVGDMFFVRGEYARAVESYGQIHEERRRKLGELSSAEEASASMRLARLAQVLGRYEDALAECVKGVALTEHADPIMAATFEAHASLTCLWAGHASEARRWLAAGRARLGQEGAEPGAEGLRVEALLHRAEGNLELSRGEPLPAIEAYQKGLLLCERVDDPWERSIALFNIAEAYADAGQHDRALAFLDATFAAKLQLGDRWGLAHAHHTRAAVLRDRGDVERALEAAEAGLELATQIDHPKLVTMLRRMRGELRLLRSDFIGAEQDLEVAWRKAEEDSALPELVAALADSSEVAREQGQLSRASTLALTAHDLAATLETKEPLALALLRLGEVEAAGGALAEAEARYAVAINLARPLGNRRLWSSLQLALARVKVLRGDYEASRGPLRALLEEAGQSGNLGHRGEAGRWLAEGFYLEGDADRAIAAAEGALSDFEALGARKPLGGTHELLARILQQTNDPRRAETHARAAVEIFASLGDAALRELGRAHLTLGHVLHFSGSYAPSADAFRVGFGHLERAEDTFGLVDGQRAIAMTRMREAPEEAAEHLRSALHLAKEVSHRLGEALASGTLGEVYRRLGRLDEAFAAFRFEKQGLVARGYQRGLSLSALHFASVHWLWGDLAGALAHADECVRLEDRMGSLGRLRALELRGLVRMEMGQFDEGSRDLDRALALAEEHAHPERLASVSCARAEAALWRGDVERAGAALTAGEKAAAGLSDDNPLLELGSLVRERLGLCRARLSIAAGQPGRAVAAAGELLDHFTRLRAVPEELAARAVLCEAEIAAGDPSAAEHAAELLSRAEDLGFGTQRADALWLVAAAKGDAGLAAEGLRAARALPSPPRVSRFEKLLARLASG
ncbi:serine/threonine-protein kinase [Polyangium aurulentum]|uniref:serine/threonine-protein kinase n=1 Tax=Polyangium aurulentum TaxID=2567896 RepID=UPI00146DF4DB|nr:serine/threonine-protein kinase [Polyangium aurulentum]UQA60753.1 protein kinase [Polyangium aurulentum]